MFFDRVYRKPNHISKLDYKNKKQKERPEQVLRTHGGHFPEKNTVGPTVKY